MRSVQFGIIDPKCIDGTVIIEWCAKILENDFIPIIQSEPYFEKMWFMKDGAWCNRTKKLFDVLKEHFGNRNLALKYLDSEVPPWMRLALPPYSLDLITCDTFLWGYIKDNVYRNNLKPLLNSKMPFMRSLTASIFQHFSGCNGKFRYLSAPNHCQWWQPYQTCHNLIPVVTFTYWI